MKLNILIAGLCMTVAAAGTSRVFAEPIEPAAKEVMIDGEVIRYEPGQVIVIRGVDNKEVVYALAPTAVVPAEVTAGRHVTLFTELRQDGGTQLVSRVTTTTVMPNGDTQRTTEESRTLPSGTKTRTTTTETLGTVEVYEAGKTLTILRSDGSKATYMINKKSKVPAGIVIGKTVSVLPMAPAADSDATVVKSVRYVTTTTTKTKAAPVN